MRLHRPVINRSWDSTKAAVAWAVQRRGRATMSDNQPIAVHWKSGQERARNPRQTSSEDLLSARGRPVQVGHVPSRCVSHPAAGTRIRAGGF